MEVDELYGLALDRFIPERAALVRALRSAGQRDQAATVAAARKPSVAAWAVNQLVRTRGDELDELLSAGDSLSEAQQGVLAATADARDLRAAAERERAAVAGLVATARGLLDSGGHELSAATLERVSDTLHAAAVDDEARRQVVAGCLVRELRHAGLGAGLGGAFAPAPARARAPAHDASAPEARGGGQDGADAEARREAKARHEAEASERREREAARRQARATERDAARELDRAQRAVHAAQERQAGAAEALRQADAGVADAESGLKAAQAAHRQAAEALDSLA